ncbi:hypothetical protein [Burkholderia sp. Bp8963]|nr:hypothetical protein [Burkholderia sp. Bp8963]
MALRIITAVGKYLAALEGDAAGKANEAHADDTDDAIFNPQPDGEIS